MSLPVRDREAFDIVTTRTFAGAHVASIDLELQARRLTVRLYGALRRGDRATALGTVTFFGAGGLRLENADGAFPESVAIADFSMTYDDETDRGSAQLEGSRAWSLGWDFDGLAYEEHAALLASLADEFTGSV